MKLGRCQGVLGAVLVVSAWRVLGCEVVESEPGDPELESPRCVAAEVLDGQNVERPVIEHSTLDDVSGVVTWRAADGVHRVVPSESEAELTVLGGAELVIEPCAVVEIAAGASIEVSEVDGAPAQLSALGDATHPILITGVDETPGSWRGIALYGGSTATLSSVTVEYGTAVPRTDSADGDHGAALVVADRSELSLVDSTIRGSSGSGIRLVSAGRLAENTAGNTLTGNAAHPLAADWVGDSEDTYFASVDRLPDGAYAGNGDDRVLLEGEESLVLSGRTVTLTRLSLPYLLYSKINHIGVSLTIEDGGELVVEPGAVLQMAPGHGEPYGFESELRVGHGGALRLEGTAESPIVLEGMEDGTEPTWGGVSFRCDTNDAGVAECPAPSIIRHVRLKNAGGMDLTSYGCLGTCWDDAGAWCTGPGQTQGGAILVADDMGGSLAIDHVTFEALGPHTYGVFRNYCGSGEPEYSTENVFVGEYRCSETDQSPCEMGEADFVCDPDSACCDHAFRCFGKE